MKLYKLIVLILIILVVSTIVFSQQGTFKNLDWKVTTTDHFKILYPDDASVAVIPIRSIAENALETFKKRYPYPFDESFVITIDIVSDIPSMSIENDGKLTISLYGIPDYINKGCFETELVTTLYELFIRSVASDFVSFTRKMALPDFSVSTFMPYWFIRGLSETRLGYKLNEIDDIYISMAKRILNDGVMNYTTLYNRTSTSAVFGMVFVNYLATEYNVDKISSLLNYMSGIKGSLSLNVALENVYGKNLLTLLKELEEDLDKTSCNQNIYIDSGEDVIDAIDTFGGSIFTVQREFDRTYTRILKDNEEITSFTSMVWDIAVYGEQMVYTVINNDYGIRTTRLVTEKNGTIIKTGFENISEVALINETYCVGIKNTRGLQNLVIMNLDDNKSRTIYSSKSYGDYLSEIRSSPGGEFVAFRLINSFGNFLGLYNLVDDKISFYKMGCNFTCGEFSEDGLLLSTRGEQMDIALFDPEETSLYTLVGNNGCGIFPYFLNEKIIELSWPDKNKLFFYIPNDPEKVSELSKYSPLTSTLSEDFDLRKYSVFKDWSFDGLTLGNLKIGTIHSDLLDAVQLETAFGYFSNIKYPSFGIETKLQILERTPINIELDARLTLYETFLDLTLGNEYTLTDFLSIGWNVRITSTPQLSFDAIVRAEDSIPVFGGQFLLDSSVSGERIISNSLDEIKIGLGGDFAWNKKNIQLGAKFGTKFSLSATETYSPFAFNDMYSDEMIVFGLRLGTEIRLSKRNTGFPAIINLTDEGFGAYLSGLIDGETFQWRFKLYKYETIYPYQSFPVKIKAGIDLLNLRILPYLSLEF